MSISQIALIIMSVFLILLFTVNMIFSQAKTKKFKAPIWWTPFLSWSCLVCVASGTTISLLSQSWISVIIGIIALIFLLRTEIRKSYEVEERHRKADALLDKAEQVAGAARIKNQKTLQEVKRTQEQCREIQDALQRLSSSKNAASGNSNGQDGDKGEK